MSVAQEQQGLRADTYTYSLLMNGFAHARRPDMAFKLVSWQLEHDLAIWLAEHNQGGTCFEDIRDIGHCCHFAGGSHTA